MTIKTKLETLLQKANAKTKKNDSTLSQLRFRIRYTVIVTIHRVYPMSGMKQQKSFEELSMRNGQKSQKTVFIIMGRYH